MRFSWRDAFVAGTIWAGVVLTVGWLYWTFAPSPAGAQSAVTYYVSQRAGDGLSAGNDSHACEQAKNKTTPRASVNRGIACLKGGDTLMIGPGTYDELVASQTGSSTSCNTQDAAAQPGCAPYPNGLSESQPTTLKATGTETILSPMGRAWPGGGSTINNYDYARFIHIEGLRVVKNAAAGSASGIYTGNGQYITIKGNTLDNGQIKGGVTSRYMKVVGNHVFNTGKDSCPPGVKPTPSGCPHGMYICGTDHTISDNVVRNTSYYGIQVSCEQGGIARIKLERNRVENSPVVGIRCSASDCLIAANVLIGNGTAITVGGSGVITNNTIHGYFQAPWDQDPWGIYGSLNSFTVTNNLLTNMKSSFLAISNNTAAPSPSLVHHNMCETTGNVGCTLIAPDAAIYTNASGGDFTLKSGSAAIGVGVAGAAAKDINGNPFVTPDLGAYAAGSVPPIVEPPPVIEPPPTVEPPPNIPLAGLTCTGDLGAEGKITLTCVPTEPLR